MHVTSSPPLENVFDFNIIHLLMTIFNDTHSSRLRTVRIMDTWLSWKNSNFKTELNNFNGRTSIHIFMHNNEFWWGQNMMNRLHITINWLDLAVLWTSFWLFFSRYPLYRFRKHLAKHCHFLWKGLLSRICKWSNRKTEKKLSRENRKRTKMSESNRNEWNPHSFQQLSKWIIDLEAFESQ